MTKKQKKKKLALHWKILLGMAAGVIFSLVLLSTSWGASLTTHKVGGEDIEISRAALFVKHWIKPFGNMFINALKLIAVPLILASLIKGVSDLKDISKLSKMGLRTISTYVVTTLLAVTIGLLVVNSIDPGKSITEETRDDLVQSYSGDADSKIKDAEKQKESGPLQALEDLIPSNIFNAASNNGNMLQVIIFAIFFGIGLILIPEEKSKPVKAFFDGFNEVILKLIDLIMLAAPVGVFALLAGLVVESPSKDLFAALLWYSVSVVIGLFIMIVVIIPVLNLRISQFTN